MYMYRGVDMSLRLVTTLTGWLLLLSYLFYDYLEYGSGFLKHFSAPEHPNQHIFHLVMFLTPLFTTYLGYILQQKDILLKKAETERAKGESILEAIGDAISIQDAHYRILYQNQLHREILGSHLGEYCYKAYQNNDNVCEGCHLAFTLRDGGIHSREQQRITPKGTAYYEIKSSPLRDSSGNVIAAIEAVRDITARRRAEEALLLARFTVDNVADAVYWIDSEAQLVDVNETACRMLGYTREELLNLTVIDIDPEFSADKWLNVWKALKDNGRMTLETKHRTKDGRVIPVEIMANYLTFGGREIDCAFARDISERKRAEEDLRKTQKLESLGILAGGIAHDFNNILTAIMGNISLLRMEMNQAEPFSRRLEAAEKASYHAKELTQQLLTFAKGGAPVKSTVSLAQFVSDTVDFALRGGNVRCDFSFAEGLWPVEVDEGQMVQVLNNLVINACQAMSGGGTIRIAAQNAEIAAKDGMPLPDGRYVKVSIEDQGTGIADEHLQRIFDPYFTTKQKGSGLGLSIVYSVIRNHNGHVAVQSRPGAGTTFTIYLPASVEKVIRKRQEGNDNIAGKGRVLLMDDEALVREVAGEILKRMGYSVEFASDGIEAVGLYKTAMASSHPFDAVIIDLTIPGGMGGKEAIQKLREVDPGVRAIVSSGYSQDPVMANYREYGFSEVIAKPYSSLELSRIMRKVIAGPQNG
jgi:PAS domain S-box-containing protein